jgi:hypothetical protein
MIFIMNLRGGDSCTQEWDSFAGGWNDREYGRVK